MDTASVVVMVLVLALVWGGFAGFLVLAWRKERERNRVGE
jgi:hypothetical protein